MHYGIKINYSIKMLVLLSSPACLVVARRVAVLVFLRTFLPLLEGVHGGAFSRFESAEIGFARDRLVREAGTKTDKEDIRKAYRRLALRLNQNLYGKNSQLEAQMRMLNLAKDALIKGEKLSADDDVAAAADKGEHVEEGRQLGAGKRLSEDIAKSMRGWQEEAVENGVRFDDPDDEFEGNTQVAFDEALFTQVLQDPTHEINRGRIWQRVSRQNETLSVASKRVIERRMNLALQACGWQEGAMEVNSPMEMVHALEEIASVQWDGRSYTCPSSSQFFDDEDESADAEDDSTFSKGAGSSNRRSRPCSPCGKRISSDNALKSKLFTFARELRGIVKMERLQELEKSRAGKKVVMAEEEEQLKVQVGEATDDLDKVELSDVQLADPFCKQRGTTTYELLSTRFNDFQYSKVVDAAFPLDPCALVGLEQFVKEKTATHSQIKANFTESAEVDRKLIQGLRGLLGVQQAKYNAPIGLDALKKAAQRAAAATKKNAREDKGDRKEKKGTDSPGTTARERRRHSDPSYKTKRRRSKEQADTQRREKAAKQRALVPAEKREEEQKQKEFEHKRHRVCLSKKRKEESERANTAEAKEEQRKSAPSPLLHALKQLEETLWQGTGFPELHESAAKAIAELSETLQLQRVLVEENLETLHNIEPLHDPATQPVFPHLSFPGLALRPYIVYETGMIREWGDEWGHERRASSRKKTEAQDESDTKGERTKSTGGSAAGQESPSSSGNKSGEQGSQGEGHDLGSGFYGDENDRSDESESESGSSSSSSSSHGDHYSDSSTQDSLTEWHPVKVALGYLDLVPYCDMQSQVVGSFLQAGFWFYKALQNLDEHCGNDDWQSDFVIPELLSAPAEIRQTAMIYALKKASLEMLDTAVQIASHLVAPNVRFMLMRTALRVRSSLLRDYGTLDDVPKLVKLYLDYRKLQQFAPFWRPPAILIGDMLFADVLSGRLQEGFLSGVFGLDPIVAPVSRKDLLFAKYESDLIQHAPDFETSRYDAMTAALEEIMAAGGIMVNTTTGALMIADGQEGTGASEDWTLHADGSYSPPAASSVTGGINPANVVTTSSGSGGLMTTENGFAILEQVMRPRFLSNYFDDSGFFQVYERESRLERQRRRRSDAERDGGFKLFEEMETSTGEAVDVVDEEDGQQLHQDDSEQRKHGDRPRASSSGTTGSPSSVAVSPALVSKRFSHYRLSDTFLEDGNTFSHIEGLEFDLDTGHLYLMGSQNNPEEEPLIDAEDVAMLLTTVVPGEPAFATVDPIAAFHPFQKVTSNMRHLVAGGVRTKVEETLSFLAYLVQQIAAQVEISAVAPFTQRVSRLGLEINKVEIGEPWEVPRVWLECSQVEFEQSMSFDGRLRFTLKNDVEVEINDGERLAPLQIETWSLGKLKDTIRFLEKRNYDPNVKIPRFDFGLVVDKEELVETVRELIKRNPDVFLEEEGENHPLKRFGRRLTHAYRHKLRHWPLFRRFEEMCKLKALSSVLDSRRQQIAHDGRHADARAQKQAENILKQQWAQWEEVLAQTRQELLRTELQVTDFDPGKCWNGAEFTFLNCCNGVGQGDPFSVNVDTDGNVVGQATSGTCFDGRTFTYERCCPLGSSASSTPSAAAPPAVKRDTIRAVAAQLSGMTNKAVDAHALTNRVDEYVKQPWKVHALRKVVVLLYEGEEPVALKARLVKQFLQVHQQMEQDMDLLKAKLDTLGGSSTASSRSSTSSPHQDGAAGATAQSSSTEQAKGVSPSSTSSRPLEVWDLLPAISTPKKIYAGVSLGPQMVPSNTFKNQKSFERIPFASILKKKESFQHYHKENLITLELEKLAFGQKTGTASSGTSVTHTPSAAELLSSASATHAAAAASSNQNNGLAFQDNAVENTMPLCSQEWVRKRSSDLELQLQPGDPVRVVNTVGSEQGLFVESVTVSGPKAGTPLRRLIALVIDDGSTKYFDATSEWDVYVKQDAECTKEEDLARLWPRCVHQNKYVKGGGIFLNLAHFGIHKGCFQDDCSHSDHFASESAGLCADVCRLIPACKFWSVTVAAEFTCWLKGSRESMIDKPGALAGESGCHPPTEEHAVKKKTIAPTLFERLRGKAVRFPKAAEVLSLFGHKTREEIAQGPKSTLAGIALQGLASL
ncbi:unnamed protein product [Amoebophrya sp. A25]|nr:unnamed protein product [Amoebophrya sp. A25]|eukprot:GSA25T00014037001.1